MKIKIRPAILILSGGMVAALIIICWGIINTIVNGAPIELLAALIAFGGTITTGLATLATKIIESEEQSQ